MNAERTGEKPCTPKLFCSPIGLLAITALSIFAAEAIVMVVISALPQDIPVLSEAFIDAVLLTIIVVPVLYFSFYRPLSAHMAKRVKVEESREKLIGELQTALEKIKVLSGLLPVCASCKRIRDDGGGWVSMEKYISSRSDAQFTHSICDICAERLYGLEGIDIKTGSGG
jgi:hypothetical protein